MRKGKKTKASSGEATEVFRQFAWNLAGTLDKRPARAERSTREGRR